MTSAQHGVGCWGMDMNEIGVVNAMTYRKCYGTGNMLYHQVDDKWFE
jgi:hypothetical protein